MFHTDVPEFMCNFKPINVKKEFFGLHLDTVAPL